MNLAHNLMLLCLAFGSLLPLCHAGDVLAPLKFGDVKVGGEIGRRIEITVKNNLLVLNTDKDFLKPFQTKTARSGYIGLGKLIDSSARLAAYTGDLKVLALKKHLVKETIRTQEPDGYIGIMKPEERVSRLWDIHEMGYLVFGLLCDYELFHEDQSLAAARKLTDYIVQHWDRLPPDWDHRTRVATNVSVTGLERTMLALAHATGDPRYRDFVIQGRALSTWNPEIEIGRRVGINGHVYAYLARCLAQIDLYRDMPQPRLLEPMRRALDFITSGNGMAITGGIGQWEIWTADQDGRGELAETCATAYQIRLYDYMLRLEGKPVFGDLMERTIFNTLFAAQSPDGRYLRYFAPFEGPRVYYPRDTYCCPCNFRRIIAELPQMICYRADSGIAVNLYTPSEAKVDLGGGFTVSIRQITAYPSDGRVAIEIEPSRAAEFPLLLRIPAWCSAAKASVNGESVGTPRAGEFLSIKRTWKSGDKVELDLPMPWRLIAGRQRQAGRVAIMRGPLVYALNPALSEDFVRSDGADLGRLVLVPSTLEAVIPDATIRPGGTACRIKASARGAGMGDRGELTLTLTEFADPNAQCVYFRVANLSVAVPDELVRPR